METSPLDHRRKKPSTVESDSEDGGSEHSSEENGREGRRRIEDGVDDEDEDGDEERDGDGVTVVFRPKSGRERVQEHYQWMNESVFHGNVLGKKVECEREKEEESRRSDKELEDHQLDWKELLRKKMHREFLQRDTHIGRAVIGKKRARPTYFHEQKEKGIEAGGASGDDDTVEDTHFNDSDIVGTSNLHVGTHVDKKSSEAFGEKSKRNWLEKTFLLRSQLCNGRARGQRKTRKISSKRSEGPIEQTFSSALRHADSRVGPFEVADAGLLCVELTVISLRKESGVCLCLCLIESISEELTPHFPTLIRGDTIDLVLRSSDEIELGVIPGGSIKIDGKIECCNNPMLPRPLLWTWKHIAH
eukprot:TRINITY_DN1085_c0_g1_i2.p1 TRINITY_DN1085_c0_g1~~TRINITY_DN1085_c0_g1_i2.p1  ORF type:complete len:360 (-),score=99.54 TRINITY_DN1085_c0_g1_i2:822-1901(-)